MAFCRNCGQELTEGTKFCPNCGAAVDGAGTNSNGTNINESSNSGMSFNRTNTTNNGMGYDGTGSNNSSYSFSNVPRTGAGISNRSSAVSEEVKAKKPFYDKLGPLYGIILFIVACIAVLSDPPIKMLLLSIVVLVGGVVCFIRKYKLKFLVVLAMLLAILSVLISTKNIKNDGLLGKKNDRTARNESVYVPDTPVTKPATTSKPVTAPKPTVAPKPVVESEPAEEEVKEEVQEEEETVAEEKNEEPAVVEKEESGGVTPEFKKAMDDYEQFYDEYCDFMEKYINSDPMDSINMLADYAKMLEQLEEMDKSFEEMGKKEMSTADYNYYIDVNARIQKKLLSVMD